MRHFKVWTAMLAMLGLVSLSFFLRREGLYHPTAINVATAPANNPLPLPASAKATTATAGIAAATINATTNAPAQSSSSSSAKAPRYPQLEKFAAWARGATNGGVVSAADGVELAKQRREVMKHLIETDPQQALQWAAPFGWRKNLPAEVTPYLEQQIDGRGSFNVLMATDFDSQKATVTRSVNLNGNRYDAFVYGTRVSQLTQSSIPLHGIAVGGEMAVSEDAVRILTAEEVTAAAQAGAIVREAVCGVSGQPADYQGQQIAGDIGGEVVFFCCGTHYDWVNKRLAAAGGSSDIPTGGSAGPPSIGWTQGPKTVLYMRVNFPDDLSEPITASDAYARMSSVNDFYVQGSYNTTSLTPTVTPLLTLPQSKAWYSTAGPEKLLADARAAAAAAGFVTGNFSWDIVCHPSVPGFNWGGLAYVGGKGVWLQQSFVGVTCHELGHNYGLWHANYWDTTNNSSIIGPGEHVEYGNVFDTMGPAGGGDFEFNAMHKTILQWLPNDYYHSVTTNGVYRIFPFDGTNRVVGNFMAAKIHKDFQRDYWVEFRQRFAANPWQQNGVMLNWSPWMNSAGGTHLLDTTPGTPTPNDSRDDAALVIGRTFTDATAGVNITPIARGADTTNAWIDVQVNLGTFPSNHAPILAIEIDQTNVAPGALVHFHATATDPDGDTLAYAWTFDDLTFSTNDLPWTTNTWTAPGEHVVRCVASDMKGGIASANGVVTVGSATGYRITGRVTDTNGTPLEGVRVDNGEISLASYFGGYTDSQGYYVIAGVPGDVTLTAIKYGFTNTPATNWSNPIQAAISNADFIALPMPVVTIAAATNDVFKNDSTHHPFTLTRTGDTNADLSVTLYLSGTAVLGNDYLLAGTPKTNLVVIPAGSSSVTLDFAALNYPFTSGTTTVTLTIFDDTNYVNGSLSEATVNIDDPNVAPQPTVSVIANTTAGDHSTVEGAWDGNNFVFSRTGATANPLTVNYSVSGSAVAGANYQPLLGVVIIPAGQASVAVPLHTYDNLVVETNKTVIVSVANNFNYVASPTNATIIILDNDATTVTLTPTDADVEQPGNNGRFTVMRAGDLMDNLTVFYGVGGSAVSGVDYQPLSGSVTIAAGLSSADIVVTPLNNASVQSNVTLTLTLITSLDYNVGTPGVASVVLTDSHFPGVTIVASAPTVSEVGPSAGEFTITCAPSAASDLAVNFSISGTAVNGVDYVPINNSVIIPAGSSSTTIEIVPFNDLFLETNESVILNLLPSAAYNVSSAGAATVLILDASNSIVPAVGFNFASSSFVESLSPGVSVALSVTSAVPVMVDYHVLGGTAPGSRYSFAPGTLTFQPGELAKSLPLNIVDDSIIEPPQTIILYLSNPQNATLDGLKIHTYTILDNDAGTASVAATVATTAEGSSTPANFRITRTGLLTNSLVVNYEITGTASAPTDYGPLGTSATIAAGASFVDLPVAPVNDLVAELPETVVMTLTSVPGGAVSSNNTAVVTITDNDSNTLPAVTVTSALRPYTVEGGGVPGEFDFTRTGPTNASLNLLFTVTGTAKSGTRYAALPTNLIIPAGQSTASLMVTPMDDTKIEGEETVVVTLTAQGTYRMLDPAAAAVVIQDNDQSVRLDASDFSASKVPTNFGEFTFTRTGTTNGDLTVHYTISGTASNGFDYEFITNSVIVPAGQRMFALPIVPRTNGVPEGPVTVTLTLAGGAGYSLDSPASGTVTIQDNEPVISIIAKATNASEDGLHPGIFTLARTGDTNIDFIAHLVVAGTATYGVDYPAFPTNVLFCCGVASIDITIYPTNDLIVEGQETVTVALLPDTNHYTIGSPSNVLITIDDVGSNAFPYVAITRPATNLVFLTGTNVGLLLSAIATNRDTNTMLTLTWTNLSGPAPVTFGDPTMSNTFVNFTNTGTYLVRVIADDGVLQSAADLTVVVNLNQALGPDLLYWTFDDGSGTNAADASGAGHAGAVVGTTNWVTNGVLGGALGFPGTNAFVRQADNANFLDGLRAFTISLWLHPAATNSDLGFIAGADAGGTNVLLGVRLKPYDAETDGTNVIEAIIPTTGGVTRYVSTNNAVSNGWQHVALTWSNGVAPALFINGREDASAFPSLPIAGLLTNCAHFLAGIGPESNSWNGLLDDVRVFSRNLNSNEVAALAALPPANLAPIVNAGADFTVQQFVATTLAGTVADDGRPLPPGKVTNYWSLTSGPAPVTLPDPTMLTNPVTFTTAGSNVFRLTADDGQIQVFAEVTVTVTAPTAVDLQAPTSDAYELGPVAGQFTITRDGDTNSPLPIFLTVSGTASNGVDYVALTNAVIIPAGTNEIAIDVMPFLDNFTEGDESVIFTIVTNAAYSINNGSATVTIHDSPYGMWNIAHFSLEELTKPQLTGLGADFDHDGLVNFVEYAFNRDPKTAETNSPMTADIEFNATDHTNHVTITYPRRLKPRDVAYEVAISTNLLIWNSGSNYVRELSATSDGNNLTETVKAQVIAPYNIFGNQFITVRVWHTNE